MNFEDLKNPELQEKLKAAKTPEDILELAREAGCELSDEQLDGVAGGWNLTNIGPGKCPLNRCNELGG